jgi:lipoyl(octanoyl) transferase
MDLEPFQRINPCGYRGLEVTDLRALGATLDVAQAARKFAPSLLRAVGLPMQREWNGDAMPVT